MFLASAPANDGAVSGIRNGVDDAGAAEPLAQAHVLGRNSPVRSEPKGTVTAKPGLTRGMKWKLCDGRTTSCDATGETASHIYCRGKWNPL
jgi:hypothetical protein